MAVLSSTNTLSTTREQVHEALNGAAGSPEGLIIKNSDATITVYIGGPEVDSTVGWPLLAGESLSMSLVAGDNVWAVAASGTPVINLLRSRV